MFAGGDEKVRTDSGFGAGPMDKGPEFAAGLSYTPADTTQGQLPGLAQQLDPNKDGQLAAEEYAKGRASLDVSSAKLPEDFNQFRSLAVLSMSSPEAVQKILGTSAILGPEISAAEKEAEKKAAEHVAWTLVERAKQQDYLDARSTLGEAGSIFRQFGFNAEAEGCASQLKKRSEDEIKSSDAEIANLAKGDLGLAVGVEAIKKGDIVGVKHALDSIPEGHEGRKVLEGYLADVEKAGRLEKEIATLTAAMGIAEKKMVKDKGDRAGHERALKDMFEAWSNRIATGEFADTEAILKDLWEKEPWVKPALAYLEGHESGFRVSGEDLRQVEGWLFNGNKIVLGAPEIILTDLIAIEKGIDAKAFAQRAYEITSPGDRSIDEELIGNEFAVLADVYGKRDATKVYADECARHTNVMPDFLFGAAIAAPIGELAGAFTLLKASPLIWKLVSKLPFSKDIVAKIYGGAIAVTEASAVSGAFTAFEISKSVLSHPEAKVSVKDVMMQWGSLDVCMIVARMAHVPLMRTRKAMGKSKLFAGKAGAEPVIMHGQKLPALNLLGRGTFAVIDNAAQAGAFYTGGKIAHGLGWRADSPQFFQEWLSLMQFQIGGHLANKVTGGRVNQIAFEAKNRANIEASQKIAEKLAGGKGRAADAISEQIFMSHVRGDVEATALLRAADYLKGGKGGDRIDAVLETNVLLKSAGVSDNTGKVALWDGARLLAVTPEARDAYIAELEAKKAENARRTLSPSQLATAAAGTGKTPAKTPATISQVKMSASDDVSKPSKKSSDKLSPEQEVRLSKAIDRIDQITLRAALVLKEFDKMINSGQMSEDKMNELRAIAERDNWSDTEKQMVEKSITRFHDATEEAQQYQRNDALLLEKLGLEKSEFEGLSVHTHSKLPGVVELGLKSHNDLAKFRRKYESIMQQILPGGDTREMSWFSAQYFNPNWLHMKDSKLLGIIVVVDEAYSNLKSDSPAAEQKMRADDLRHEYAHATLDSLIRPVLHHYFTGLSPSTMIPRALSLMDSSLSSKLFAALGDTDCSYFDNFVKRPHMEVPHRASALRDEQNLLDELRAYSFNLGLPRPNHPTTNLEFESPADDNPNAIDPLMAQRYFEVHLLRIKAGTMSAEHRKEALAIIGVSQSLSQAKRLLLESTRQWQINSREELNGIMQRLTFMAEKRDVFLNYQIGERVYIDQRTALREISPPKEVIDEAIRKYEGDMPDQFKETYKILYNEGLSLQDVAVETIAEQTRLINPRIEVAAATGKIGELYEQMEIDIRTRVLGSSTEPLFDQEPLKPSGVASAIYEIRKFGDFTEIDMIPQDGGFREQVLAIVAEEVRIFANSRLGMNVERDVPADRVFEDVSSRISHIFDTSTLETQKRFLSFWSSATMRERSLALYLYAGSKGRILSPEKAFEIFTLVAAGTPVEIGIQGEMNSDNQLVYRFGVGNHRHAFGGGQYPKVAFAHTHPVPVIDSRRKQDESALPRIRQPFPSAGDFTSYTGPSNFLHNPNPDYSPPGFKRMLTNGVFYQMVMNPFGGSIYTVDYQKVFDSSAPNTMRIIWAMRHGVAFNSREMAVKGHESYKEFDFVKDKFVFTEVSYTQLLGMMKHLFLKPPVTEQMGNTEAPLPDDSASISRMVGIGRADEAPNSEVPSRIEGPHIEDTSGAGRRAGEEPTFEGFSIQIQKSELMGLVKIGGLESEYDLNNDSDYLKLRIPEEKVSFLKAKIDEIRNRILMERVDPQVHAKALSFADKLVGRVVKIQGASYEVSEKVTEVSELPETWKQNLVNNDNAQYVPGKSCVLRLSPKGTQSGEKYIIWNASVMLNDHSVGIWVIATMPLETGEGLYDDFRSIEGKIQKVVKDIDLELKELHKREQAEDHELKMRELRESKEILEGKLSELKAELASLAPPSREIKDNPYLQRMLSFARNAWKNPGTFVDPSGREVDVNDFPPEERRRIIVDRIDAEAEKIRAEVETKQRQIAEIGNELLTNVRENPDVTTEQLIRTLRGLMAEKGLSLYKNEVAQVEGSIRRLMLKRKAVAEYAARYRDDPKKLFKVVFGFAPQSEVRVVQSTFCLNFQLESDQDFGRVYRDQTMSDVGASTMGFNSLGKTPELFGVVNVLRGNLPIPEGLDLETTIRHEETHAINKHIQPYDLTCIALKIAVNKITNLNQLEAICKKYMDHTLRRAQDEISAYMTQNVDKKKLIEVLSKYYGEDYWAEFERGIMNEALPKAEVHEMISRYRDQHNRYVSKMVAAAYSNSDPLLTMIPPPWELVVRGGKILQSNDP